MKSKRLLKILNTVRDKNSLENAISSYRPTIFWKDKEIVKQQVNNWSSTNIENLIYQISEIELLIKKNSNNAINILSDFIIKQSQKINN